MDSLDLGPASSILIECFGLLSGPSDESNLRTDLFWHGLLVYALNDAGNTLDLSVVECT